MPKKTGLTEEQHREVARDLALAGKAASKVLLLGYNATSTQTRHARKVLNAIFELRAELEEAWYKENKHHRDINETPYFGATWNEYEMIMSK